MSDAFRKFEQKSAHSFAYEHYLRSGQRFSEAEYEWLREQKYNHNHDEIGRFTFSGNQASGHRIAHHSSPPKAKVLPRSAARPHANSGQSTRPRPFTQVGSHPARVYRTKRGDAIIDPRSGSPMLIPQGVEMANTVRGARMFSSPLNRDAAATIGFAPGGPMDLQRTYSTLRDKDGKTLIDQRFIAIGNYNFGMYAAASGMSL